MLTTKELDAIWESQEQQRKKQKRLRKYYKGEHDICHREAKHADGKHKANVPTGFAQYIVDMFVGAMTANPYQLSRHDVSGPDTADFYVDIARDTHLDSVDVENLRNALVCGYGLELHEFVDSKLNVMPERPEKWALIRDENDEIVVASTRFVLPAYSMFHGEMISAATEIMYTYDATTKQGHRRLYNDKIKGEWEQFESRKHFYGQVPVIEWRATDDRESMLSDALLRQIDEYDDIDSLSGDDIRNVSDALLKIKGISGPWLKENEDVILRMRLLPLPDDADAEYLAKSTDTQRVADRLARCREAIHTMGCVPDIQQVTGATGSTSGIALKLKFMPMQQRAEAMFKQLQKSLRKRIDVLNSITSKATKTKIENYQITMQFNMPVNRIEEWANIGALTDIVTHRTQLELLSDIDDPDSELKGLEDEQINKAEVQGVNQSPEAAAAAQDVQVAQTMPKVDGQIQTTLDIIGDRILAAVTRANSK